MVIPVFLAQLYGLEVNLSWYVMLFIIAAVLSFAVPPTPGAALTCYGIVLGQLGIPLEGMLMAVTLDIVFDFMSTGFDILLLQWELLIQADILQMLDHEKLKNSSV